MQKAKAKKANVAYYTIPVDFEITGNFIGYIKFKRQLSLSQKMLNFDKESIKVVKGDSTGAIKVNGTLTIVGLTDEFFKIILILLIYSLYSNLVQADSHDKDKNIIEKAKEINKKVKAEQAIQSANISSEVGNEEPLPLNDPFVGDGSLGGGNSIKLIAATDEDRKDLSVFNYKLVGVVEGDEDMFASLIDENGDVLTLALFEELTPGVRLIALDTKEIVFEREKDSLVVINFKNQIIERNK